jgi:triosephosphate isomerase
MWHVHNLLLLIITLTLTLTKASHEEGSGNQKLFLGCNWKCSIETCNEVDDLCNNLNLMWQSLNEVEKDKVELCINPPFVFLDRVRTRLSKEIAVGSQNAYDCRGPNIGNTGTTTAKMLQSLGCASVLLGHSDRRNNLFETNELISDKVKKALSAGLDVTLTIGELPYQRRWGLALFTLRKQLRVAMKGINKDEWDKIVIAYEPVWAVGEGATPCSPEEAQRINAYLRKYIAKRVSVEASRQCRLTYTGSVNEKNAVEYASLEDVQGFVVGRAGLDMTKLRSIIQTLADST